MANENIIRCVSKLAAGDLSGNQFYAVYLSAADTVAVCNGFTHDPTGVLRNKPEAAGRAAEVQRSGEGQIKLGGAVTAGMRLRPTTDGTWIECPIGWSAFGEAQEAGAAGEVIRANIFCEGGGAYRLSP